MKFVGILIISLLLSSQWGFAQVVNLGQEEYQFYVMLNQFRTQLGLPTVQIHVLLQSAAKKHSEWMASQNFLSHFGPINNKTPFQRIEEEGYVKYTSAGENIACGNGDALKTFRQWAFSPGHLANMVNPHFRHIGIARAGTGNEQCPYFWTNDFGSFSDSRLDPADPTDLQKISAAIAVVSGSIPSGQAVKLPETASPSASTGESSAAGVNLNKNQRYALIQCLIPANLSENTFSFSSGTDALLEFTPNTSGGYKGKVSYLKNGANTDYSPSQIPNVSIVKNSDYPLLMIFAASTKNTGGFMIQFNLEKSSAVFDPYPATNGNSGSVICSYKM